ncbi:Domain protein of unknown function (plasmid) [Phaeobacter inhibens]|jgi:hypothetical protein|uniref:DUF4177 domain-containing protein n=1 Tax=Phaeobacter inhibens TaxID=221822 RepID=A0ABN5GWR1_9RHOB|nr:MULTISPECIES: hypothetical protein [Roseobacteraceae]AUQ56904.1 Domain protein of unknown function [Phaeobacter inhibens]AUQ68884.1 Domain protein of unknown function [Phaeobacter inhibens]AUQ80921.1 Domain protein of unknown function [Phaeobacter inhibens]AUQ97309.1 Domain protein of unknown function [Phaeobacter inhibens]AUR06165.1 Domain protein of unknown function [Phaeobacter inhibens]
MKRFENEVKTFKNGSKRDEAKMQTTLRDLGLSGWEVVSVVPCDLGGRELMVFLKRELDEGAAPREEAA